MIVSFIITLFVVRIVVLIEHRAYHAGYNHGRDAEWCDHLFEKIEKDKSSRDRLGQFIPTDLRKGRNK